MKYQLYRIVICCAILSIGLLGCDKTVRRVGSFEITEKDVEKRTEFSQFFDAQGSGGSGIPLKGPYNGDGLQQLTQGLVVMSTLAVLGFDTTSPVIQEHVDRILKDMPIAAAALNQVFKGDRERFEKVVVYPFLAAEKGFEFVAGLERYKSRPVDDARATLAELLAVKADADKISDAIESATEKRNCKREKFRVEKKVVKDIKRGELAPHLLPHAEGVALGIVDEIQSKEVAIKGVVCRPLDPIVWLNREAKSVRITEVQ